MNDTQRRIHDGFVKDFPIRQEVRYLPTHEAIGRVRDIYWSDEFQQTWLEIELWDTDIQMFRQYYHLPAMLFIRRDDENHSG